MELLEDRSFDLVQEGAMRIDPVLLAWETWLELKRYGYTDAEELRQIEGRLAAALDDYVGGVIERRLLRHLAHEGNPKGESGGMAGVLAGAGLPAGE
jgi:hypothetical protein